MPYIPQFNKLSLQEISYAPTLMRQQHDEEVAKQMELAEALKFDYLKQDSEGIEPILQKYSTDIDDVSKQIAQSGFSHDIKNRVMGLRSKFVGDEKIRTYKKNYADAMSQWGDARKRMIQMGVPGDEINNQKASFFSGYQGAYTKDGEKNEFTPGRTSNSYDPLEDATKLMKGLGEQGKLVGLTGSSANITYKTDPVTGQRIAGIEFRDSKSGQVIENSKEIESMLSGIARQYADSNTDRGLWATINKKDQEALLKTITDVANAHLSNKYSHIPQNDVRWSPYGNGEKTDTGGDDMFPTHPIGQGDVDQTESANEDLAILDGKMSDKSEISRQRAEAAKFTNPQLEGYNPFLLKPSESRANGERLAKEQEQVRAKYKKLFPAYYSDGDDDKATRRAIDAFKNNAVVINQATALTIDKKSYGGVGVTEMVLDKTLSPDIDLLESQETGMFGGTTKLTKGDFIEKWGEKEWKNAKPLLQNNGDIYLRDPDDKLYKVNPRAFDNNTQELQNEVLKPVLNQLVNPRLMDDGSNVPVELKNFRDPKSGLKVMFDVKPVMDADGNMVDPYDVSQRTVHMYGLDPKTNQVLRHIEMTPAQAKNELTRGIFTGFKDIKL